MSKLKA